MWMKRERQRNKMIADGLGKDCHSAAPASCLQQVLRHGWRESVCEMTVPRTAGHAGEYRCIRPALAVRQRHHDQKTSQKHD